MTQEKNGSDPVFTPDIRKLYFPLFFPLKQYLCEEKLSHFSKSPLPDPCGPYQKNHK
jgi:hypothetical protein